MEITPDAPLVRKLKAIRDGKTHSTDGHRTLLLLGGGPARGAMCAGAALALRILGLLRGFQSVVGVSVGAGTAAYALTSDKNARLGASILYEECCSLKFFNPLRRPIADIDFLEWVLRKSGKRLDVRAVHEAPQAFYVAVANVHTGETSLVNAKEATPDIVSAVKAAVALLGLSNNWVRLNGIDAGDCISDPFPLRAVLEVLRPTELVVIANCTRQTWERWGPSIVERILLPLLCRKQPPAYRAAMLNRHRSFHRARKLLASTPVETMVLFTPYDVAPFSYNSAYIRRAANDMIRYTLAAFGEPDRPFEPLR